MPACAPLNSTVRWLVPNWEAIWIIGGGAVALCVILSALVIGIRRHRRKGRADTEGAMPRPGIVLYGLMTLALFVGFAVLPSTRFGRFGGFAFLAYAGLLVVVFTLIAAVLERKGLRFTPKPIAESPPNKSLERAREG